MARIRTIKPDFFRNEELQDLELKHPGAYPMLVFAGLWGHCDARGRFAWRPRLLKLDILPFLAFDMGATLELLEQAGMIQRYEAGGKMYGVVVTFEKHQRITGKEATDGEKHPGPNGEAPGKHQGNIGERQDVQEGKGIGSKQSLLLPTSTSQRATTPRGRNGASVPQVEQNIEGTPQGAAARAMRDAGLADANPQHPKLLALIEQGVSTAELAAAATEARNRGKGFSYALATAEGRRRDAANMPPLPDAPTLTDPRHARIEGRAKQAGTWPARAGESWDMLGMRTDAAIKDAEQLRRAERHGTATPNTAATAG